MSSSKKNPLGVENKSLQSTVTDKEATEEEVAEEDPDVAELVAGPGERIVRMVHHHTHDRAPLIPGQPYVLPARVAGELIAASYATAVV